MLNSSQPKPPLETTLFLESITAQVRSEYGGVDTMPGVERPTELMDSLQVLSQHLHESSDLESEIARGYVQADALIATFGLYAYCQTLTSIANIAIDKSASPDHVLKASAEGLGHTMFYGLKIAKWIKWRPVTHLDRNASVSYAMAMSAAEIHGGSKRSVRRAAEVMLRL